MSRLTLYTTLGCHLCETLEAELARLGHASIQLERVEIAESEALLARYGTRIPVLADEGGNELERGFERDRLSAWLEARGLCAEGKRESGADQGPSRIGMRLVNGRRVLK